MRVLVVHTKYRQYGGEDRVVHSQLDLLSRRGHDVEFVEFANSSSQLESSIALASAPGAMLRILLARIWTRCSCVRPCAEWTR